MRMGNCLVSDVFSTWRRGNFCSCLRSTAVLNSLVPPVIFKSCITELSILWEFDFSFFFFLYCVTVLFLPVPIFFSFFPLCNFLRIYITPFVSEHIFIEKPLELSSSTANSCINFLVSSSVYCPTSYFRFIPELPSNNSPILVLIYFFRFFFSYYHYPLYYFFFKCPALYPLTASGSMLSTLQSFHV